MRPYTPLPSYSSLGGSGPSLERGRRDRSGRPEPALWSPPEELAQESGVGVATIIRIERDQPKSEPHYSTLGGPKGALAAPALTGFLCVHTKPAERDEFVPAALRVLCMMCSTPPGLNAGA